MYNLEQDNDLDFIRDGNPIEAMDAAYRIINYQFPVDQRLIDELHEIATDPKESLWARISSIHALSFLDHNRVVTEVLPVTTDETEMETIRSLSLRLAGALSAAP